MRATILMFAVAVFLVPALAADEKSEGKVYKPEEAKEIKINDKDTIRFEFSSPGSTGYTTTVTVKEGPATVVKRQNKGNGSPGSGTLEFDVKPKSGKTGKIKVVVTATPPGQGRKAEVTEFEFEVK